MSPEDSAAQQDAGALAMTTELADETERMSMMMESTGVGPTEWDALCAGKPNSSQCDEVGNMQKCDAEGRPSGIPLDCGTKALCDLTRDKGRCPLCIPGEDHVCSL